MNGPAVVVLDADLQVRTQTPGAAEALHRLNPPDHPIPRSRPRPTTSAARWSPTEHGLPVGPPWRRVHLGAGRWVTLRGARMGEGDGDIAVTIEPSTPGERLEVFALAHGLTPREREILDQARDRRGRANDRRAAGALLAHGA